MNREFQVGPFRFPSKAAAQREEKEIRDSSPDLQPITGDDETFIRSLINEYYPADWYEKKLDGGAIVEMWAAPAPPPYHEVNRCWWLRLDNGRVVDIGVAKQCFREDPKLDDVRRACRSAVRPQIENVRGRYFRDYADAQGYAPCQLTGERICMANAVVHHEEPSFNAIVARFIRERGIDVESVQIDGYEAGEAAQSFADAKLAADFAEYHRLHAEELFVVDCRYHVKMRRKKD